MDEVKFVDDLNEISVYSEKEYERINGVKLDTPEIDEEPEEKLTGIEIFDVKPKQQRKDTGIGVLRTSPVKTNNSFINQTQQKEHKKQIEEEKEIKRTNPEFPYKANNLLTGAEYQLFHFMSENLCQVERIYIFPKVRLADIIQVDNRLTVSKDYLWKITNKHVDFLICRKSDMQVICAVELDDYTHEAQEAQDRDIFVMQALFAAKIRTVRIRTKISALEIEDLRLVDDYINESLAPKCPECGLPMIPRQNRQRIRFYACSDNIKCRKTMSIDNQGEKLP